ncbi:MarR family winged helix-turn-helix transcriptional regulator [Leptolyngbya sp. AN02str]|uniref:MarR family winged helix-turn-helix transcriptional regulator n=1 Tax=Leptolyngbya sp. AN02str TaxID=3423363 RepID=UPI003D3131B4
MSENDSSLGAIAKAAAQEDFMETMRELVRAYQAYATYSERHVRQLGLTSAQFDVIATLGNTRGMTMKEVARKTLVTKGTLTGIIDRLEEKGLVRREVPPENRRSFIVALTPQGESVFEQVFPTHVYHLKERFDQIPQRDQVQLRTLLQHLRLAFGDRT